MSGTHMFIDRHISVLLCHHRHEITVQGNIWLFGQHDKLAQVNLYTTHALTQDMYCIHEHLFGDKTSHTFQHLNASTIWIC